MCEESIGDYMKKRILIKKLKKMNDKQLLRIVVCEDNSRLSDLAWLIYEKRNIEKLNSEWEVIKKEWEGIDEFI